MIRAKLHVSQVILTDYGQEQAELHAVCSNTPEDNSFAKATPAATMKITIDNPAAQGFLRPGHDYYVDFTPAQ